MFKGTVPISPQGTSAEQDNRFSNKQKKLLKQLKFAECLDKKVCKFRNQLVTVIHHEEP